jgi:succinoglycan biosynthesis protein ExoL
VRGCELGDRIERLDVGWTFEPPLEDALVRFFETIGSEQYEAKRDRLLALPTDTFVAGADVAALCQKLDRLPPVAAPRPARAFSRSGSKGASSRNSEPRVG